MFEFPVFLNSKATLLAIMCIKISGCLPWVKNYQGLGNHYDKYAVKVLKQNEVFSVIFQSIVPLKFVCVCVWGGGGGMGRGGGG